MRDVVLADPADQEHDPVALFTASRLLTENWLVRELAAHHGVTWDQARGALHNVSSNLVWMLDSPQGVTTLGYIASLYLPGVDADANPIVAKVH